MDFIYQSTDGIYIREGWKRREWKTVDILETTVFPFLLRCWLAGTRKEASQDAVPLTAGRPPRRQFRGHVLWKSFGVSLWHVLGRLSRVVPLVITSTFVPPGLHHFPYQNLLFPCQVCVWCVSEEGPRGPHRNAWNFFTDLSFPEGSGGIWDFLVSA